MKQLLIFAISLCALSLNAQIKYTPLDAAGYQFKYGKADSGWHVPLRDTSIGRGATRAGAIVYKPGVGFFGWNGSYWSQFSGGGSGITPNLQDVTNEGNTTTSGLIVNAEDNGFAVTDMSGNAVASLRGNGAEGRVRMNRLSGGSVELAASRATGTHTVQFPDSSGTVVLTQLLADTAAALRGSAIDTNSLSNRINTKLNQSDTGSLSNRVNSKLNISDSTGNNGYSRNWQITDVLSKVNRFDSTGYMHIKYSIPETVTGVKTFSDSTFLNSGTVIGIHPTTTASSRRLTFRSIATNGTLMESWLQQEGVTTPGTEALKFYTNGYMQFSAYGNNGANKGVYQFAYDAKIWGQTGLRMYTTSTTSGVSIGNEYNQTSGTLFNVFNNTSTQYFSILSNGSIGINNSSPSSSALLDLTSSTKGLLIPRMTTTQRDAISSPATGLMVWNNNTSTLDAYQGNSWGSIAGDYSRQLRIVKSLGSPIAAEPFWGLAGTNGGNTLANGTGYYAAFLLEKETTITGIYWFQGISGVYTNDIYSGFSIYSVSGTTLTKLIESANDASLFKGTNGLWTKKDFPSTITLAPGVYYIGMIFRATSITTTPAIYGTSSITALGYLPGANLKVTYIIFGQNGFPATINVASTAASNYYWSLFPY